METTCESEKRDLQTADQSVGTGVAFLSAIFSEDDTIVLRPIESWTEGGKKRSKVAYKHTYHISARHQPLSVILTRLHRLAEEHRLNLYFGACPRHGTGGRFDLAWQIRTVRVLWADIDHVSVEEAQERVEASPLPQPSIIVNSGNGVHLYWLLDEPFLIDDVAEPPAVETEWNDTKKGPRPRRYFVESGERIYLDKRHHVSRLSPKAKHIQDVLAGIAKAIGGDHTTDLARLLRIPGSLNRKDERSGRTPIPTELVEIAPSRRYSIATFESLKPLSPEPDREAQLAAMPLPQTRKLSPTKTDRLNELIAASAIAEAGSRSEADFAVCCYAIRSGCAKEDLWGRVEAVGKFGEQGRRYFDTTWENAEYDTRADTLDKLHKKDGKLPGARPTSIELESEKGESERDGNRPTILIDPSYTPVGDTLEKVTTELLKTGTCFGRTDQLVRIHNDRIMPVLSSPELAGLLNEYVEFFFVKDEGGEYKPFPANYAQTWLNHQVEQSRLPVIVLYTRNPVFTEDLRLVAPGYDRESRIYYAGSPIEPRMGTDHLDALLRDFCFRTPGDRTNFIGVLLTAILMPRFIGSKPAVLFNGNQPGLGKSILAQTIAILRDGKQTETASYNSNDEEFEKRLGAAVRHGATTIIIDNAKGRGRAARIDSACLERSITDPILSFRLLGQSNSIRAENSHIFCITANSPDVSRDLVTRSVVIDLYYEGDPQRRHFSIADPEEYALQHREELLGELIGMVERWKARGKPEGATHSRFNKRGWGNIVGGILDACGEPDFLCNADEAASLLDETRREFMELVGILAAHCQGIWTASQLVELSRKHGLLGADLGEGSPRSLATKMGTIAGRFVGEQFTLDDEGVVGFHRRDARKGKVYQVARQE